MLLTRLSKRVTIDEKTLSLLNKTTLTKKKKKADELIDEYDTSDDNKSIEDKKEAISPVKLVRKGKVGFF